MNIHEYQAKDILRAQGVPIPAGEVATTPDQVEAIAKIAWHFNAVVLIGIDNELRFHAHAF